MIGKSAAWMELGSDQKRYQWAYGLAVFAWALQFVFVAYYAVDIPYFDEWDKWSLWDPGFSFQELFERHMEHRIPFSNLQTWLASQLVGGDRVVQIWLNYLVFGLECWLLAKVCRRAPGTPQWIVPAFVLFCFSTNNYANHSVAFQTQFHFCLLLIFSASLCFFREVLSPARILAGGLLCLCSMYTIAAGLVASFCLYGVYLLHLFLRRERSSVAVGMASAFSFFLLIAGAYLWFDGFTLIIEKAPPYTWAFWRCWTNLISFGFGFRSADVFWAFFCTTLVAVPLVGLLSNHRHLPIEIWRVAAVAAAVLISLASFAYGRGHYDPGKSSRYFEFAVPLVPLSAVLWAWIFRGEAWQKRALTLLWLFCFVSFADGWSFHHYRQARKDNLRNVECAREYYAGRGEPVCPYPAPKNVQPALDTAKKYGLTLFTRNAPVESP